MPFLFRRGASLIATSVFASARIRFVASSGTFRSLPSRLTTEGKRLIDFEMMLDSLQANYRSPAVTQSPFKFNGEAFFFTHHDRSSQLRLLQHGTRSLFFTKRTPDMGSPGATRGRLLRKLPQTASPARLVPSSAFFFFFFFLVGEPMGVGRASVYNNVSTSRGQWASAGPHNMEHGNIF